MQVNQVNSQSFAGKIGIKTLEKLEKNLTPKEYNMAKKFRVGEKNTTIDIVTLQGDPQRLLTGTVVLPKETFAVIKNSRRKNAPPVFLKMADGELPINLDTLKMISEALVFKGEKILKNLRG